MKAKTVNDKTLYTGKTFFNKLVEILKDNGTYPSIFEYTNVNSEHEFRNETWDLIGDVRFGSNEGIYLTLYIDDSTKITRLATLKTLNDDKESFFELHKLLAGFAWEARKFVNENLDDFNWTGYDLKMFNNEKCFASLWCSGMDPVKRHLAKVLENPEFTHAIVTDNEKCNDTVYKKEDIPKVLKIA